jgi:hypothetical protein
MGGFTRLIGLKGNSTVDFGDGKRGLFTHSNKPRM